MTVFIDTSALYAVIDRYDQNHRLATDAWRNLLESGVELLTTNYVVVEATALVQNRLGSDAVRVLLDDTLGIVEVRYVDGDLHRAAVAALLAARQRGLSLVDCASFLIMRNLDIETVFAFDRHFIHQGFRSVGSRPASERER